MALVESALWRVAPEAGDQTHRHQRKVSEERRVCTHAYVCAQPLHVWPFGMSVGGECLCQSAPGEGKTDPAG